jgi:uncharacterized repeat protein (TIGR03803 family)
VLQGIAEMTFGPNFTLLRTIGFLVAAAISSISLCSVAFAYSEKTLYTFCSLKGCPDGGYPYDVVRDSAGNLYGTTFGGGNTVPRSACTPEGFYGCGVVFEFAPSTGQYSVLHTFCTSDCTDGAFPQSVKLVIDEKGNLYGTTRGGGVGGSLYGTGVVFELIRGTSGWSEEVLYTFCSRHNCVDGGGPYDGLTYANAAAGKPYNGKSRLYGTTTRGGANGRGTVFTVSREAGTHKWKQTVLYSFCPSTGCTDGETPDTPLYVDSAGNIYGTTYSGGQNGQGVVFELSPGGTGFTESVLYSFCAQANCVDGGEPYGGVIMDGLGNLFGAADYGGSPDLGVVFELSFNGSQWNYNILDNFNGSNGSHPAGAMIFGSDGNLYGTTYRGGANGRDGDGTVFTFNGAIQNLYSFCSSKGCPDGKYPLAGVVQDSAGNLFGTTSYGGKKSDHGHTFGTLYELSP